MKTATKNSLPELLSNPISRNLILILIGAMLASVGLVTAVFLVIG
jgi:hypothetical protein